jgi:4-amino-4-deoxy-L-arabinose transferase-like glycosyltransferase
MRLTSARKDTWFLGILLAAGILRLHVATVTPTFSDEEEGYIPLAESISFSATAPNLPLRGRNHPALAGYVVKTSGTLFGTSRLGYRALNLVAGLTAILFVFLLTRHWYGATAARWAASLLAFNEYHIQVSSVATSHAPHLLFVVLAIYAFQRFLATERPAGLYGAATAVALAFYCKEHSVLLLPASFFMLVQPRYRGWLRTRHVYLALALLLALTAPDIVWNVTTGADPDKTTYGDHLARVGGIGFSPYPLAFFGRDTVRWLRLVLTGRRFSDYTPEYETMNPVLGLLLLGASAAAMFRPGLAGPAGRYLLILFGTVFGFFLLMRPGDQEELDPVSWSWVDMSLFPAVVLTGACLATASPRWRLALWPVACAAMLWAVVRMLA